MTYRKLNDLIFLMNHVVILKAYNGDQKCVFWDRYEHIHYLGLWKVRVMVTQKFKEAQSRSALKHLDLINNVRHIQHSKKMSFK